MRITLRLDDEIHNKLNGLNVETKKSINSLINEILAKELLSPQPFNVLEELNGGLKTIALEVEKISKLQHIHFDLTVQDFVNNGYAMNMDKNKDKCYQELRETKESKING
ncbi:MAG TPA: hypothetical protein PLT65_00685 [Bacilli bacterium]|nr:hypothetical protein [Bacilli bacterium]